MMMHACNAAGGFAARFPAVSRVAVAAAVILGLLDWSPPAADAQSALGTTGSETRTFHVETAGSGPDMILIPGLASPGRIWEPTLAEFGGAYRTHVLTIAGFAGLPPVPDTPLLPAVAAELAAYIEANGLDKPIVVGHSLGGFLALKLAAARPDLVGGVVIVDALPFLPAVQLPGATPEAVQGMAEAMRQGMAAQNAEAFRASQDMFVSTMITDPARAKEVAAWTSRSDPGVVAQAMYELFTIDIRPDLERIEAPVLVYGSWVAYGARDDILATFQREYANLDGVRIELSDHGRHFLMYDDPEGLHQSIRRWLNHHRLP